MGLFYTKMPNSKVFIWARLEQYVWGALVPQGNLGSKSVIKQNVFRIPFRMSLGNAEMQNSQICILPL